MRTLRCLFVIALVCSLAPAAKANNFAMVVVDPLPVYVNVLTSTSFDITLGACQPGQVPTGAGDPTYDGCYTGLNDTGKALTSLDIFVPVIPGFTPTCPTAPGGFFTMISCSTLTPDGKDYIFSFSGGDGIPTATDCDHDGDGRSLNSDDFVCDTASIFTIAEAGIGASDFPPNISVVADAPEPSPFWLLSTGVLSVGLFVGDRRRRALCRTHG